MPGIDASIPLRAVSQIDSPLESYGKVAGLKSLLGQQRMQEMQLQQAEQAREQEAALNEAYRDASSGGSLDRGALLSSLAPRGLGSLTPGLQKQFADADKAGLDVKNTQSLIDERTYGMLKKRTEATNAMFSSLLSRPNVTHEDVIGGLSSLVHQGLVSQEDGLKAVQSLPPNPQALRSFLMQKGMEGLEAAKRLEMLTPKFEMKNTGKQLVPVDTNAMTNPTPQALTMTTTPGEDQSAATQRRGQNMIDQRSREGNAALMSRPFEVTGPDGEPVLVQQDQKGNIAPVQGFAPKGGTSKPLPQAVVKQITEARDNAATIDRLTSSFKSDFAGKGVLGIGADKQMGISGIIGADKDAVAWWKDYRKQAELVERHALFGAALTPGEQESWRSADISPGMDAAVVEQNLATRAALAKKVAENARQDMVDAGHSEKRVNAIAGRNKGAPVPIKSDADYDKLPSGTRFLAPDGTTRVKP